MTVLSLVRNFCLLVLVWNGCASVPLIVEVPPPPRAPLDVVSEIDFCVEGCGEPGSEIWLCPASRRYVLDEIEPYFDGLEAINNGG